MGAVGEIQRNFEGYSSLGRLASVEHIPTLEIRPTLYQLSQGRQEEYRGQIPGQEYLLHLSIYDHPHVLRKVLRLQDQRFEKLEQVKLVTRDDRREMDDQLTMQVSVNSDPLCIPSQLHLHRVDREGNPFYSGTTRFTAQAERLLFHCILDVYLTGHVLASFRVVFGEGLTQAK